MRVLSALEAEVLQRYVDGKSYQEIADDLGRHVKSIDNALQRVKRKIAAQLERHRWRRPPTCPSVVHVCRSGQSPAARTAATAVR